MGKATDLDQQSSAKPLSAAEIKAREELTSSSGDLVATLDGKLVKPAPSPAEERVVVNAPQQTWD